MTNTLNSIDPTTAAAQYALLVQAQKSPESWIFGPVTKRQAGAIMRRTDMGYVVALKLMVQVWGTLEITKGMADLTIKHIDGNLDMSAKSVEITEIAKTTPKAPVQRKARKAQVTHKAQGLSQFGLPTSF